MFNLLPLSYTTLSGFKTIGCYKSSYLLTIAFVLPFIVASGTTTSAQILNIERARVEQDSANYITGKTGINFSMFNRNAGKDNPNNYLQLTFNGDVAYISPKHSYLLLTYYNYLLINYDNQELRNTVASNGYAHFRVNLLRQRRLSYELFTQFQADKARGLDLRALAGAGVRLAVLRQEKVNLYAGTGLMQEHETWQSPEEGEVILKSDLLKITNYVSTKAALNSHVNLEGIVYYQTGYDTEIDAFRNRVSGDLNLLFKLNTLLSFKTGFNCTYEDRPIVPVTRFVYAITNGVQVNF
ncbi:DUF481 domain-containing protein [Pontibacter sp. Tf4]|uniref:DUF481 domain-containing protein n=1 Tax=Pontibacter sp. Tf4 TaxID=2761620 RepID=UPI0016289EDC|nr:DUF481 domain-containing protein [Pontibacter sp. Tf4]MBB6610348.1 DUF481 domain-containing protein [Pontibacter sp. Tf4]